MTDEKQSFCPVCEGAGYWTKTHGVPVYTKEQHPECVKCMACDGTGINALNKIEPGAYGG